MRVLLCESATVATRWFRRRWEESRGDDYNSWGPATYFFEVGLDGWPTRQIEVYDNGPTLRYGPEHVEDRYGQLGQSRVDELEDWTSWMIPQQDFERAWVQKSQ